MDGERFGTRLDIPKVGEHARELVSQLGYNERTMAKLVENGVLAAT